MNNLKTLIKEIIFLIIWVVIIGTPTYFIKKDQDKALHQSFRELHESFDRLEKTLD
ncbi:MULTISPECIES: hypothetical protein [Candidatus Phytoplasma]|uniref:Uncharacterized protein n=2 Tax=Candidatus Phytoplasma TaxID=33926 RepID=A0ABP2TK42_PEWBP|nr:MULTISPECIES: hypothetical protein [Phytoplasma]QLL36847.1 hypothetical protein EPWB_v2c2410 ['Echinacea purpurea' witches'-broom phytoplasma]WEX20480.1 MAG: hypothetical protein TB2022_4010 [Candidatus Phytoplasma aurantifolia]WKV64095.1 MAG: hypothetical protein NCHU2022_c2420 [Candidatus Phytoplasma australasiaticum]EMR14799.1 hypothetical protein PNWB_v1c0200 [Peanut witches'-broom phytoplasma NTU2011]MDO8052701.1 hypothetical protein ['Vigna radiata' phytoplasma]